MTKQEVIQQAYGEHWEFIKVYVDENGWLDGRPHDHELSNIYNRMFNDCDKEFDSIRPKSLVGIENNNGWINPLINGLPVKSCEVLFMEIPDAEQECLGCLHTGYWNNNIGCFISYSNSEKYLFDEITHYQPRTKPKPPIY